MADIIEKTEWDQMKSWVNSIYYTTQKSYPTISDVTAGGVVLASQANQLQSLLTTAYEDFVDLNCTHNATVHSTYYTGDNVSNLGAGTTTTGNGTYKSAHYTEGTGNYGCD